jgi:predicted secreted protein
VTQFDQDSNGREVELAVGAQFAIQLVENPTTGFRWRLTSDGAPSLACLSDEFRAPAAAKPGQPGLHVWCFRCAEAGEREIKLINTRAGSAAETTGRSFTLRVRARA